MGEIAQAHHQEYQAIAPQYLRYDTEIEFMEHLVDQLIGLLHGFGAEPDPGKGDEEEGIEDLPETHPRMFALLVGRNPLP